MTWLHAASFGIDGTYVMDQNSGVKYYIPVKVDGNDIRKDIMYRLTEIVAFFQ